MDGLNWFDVVVLILVVVTLIKGSVTGLIMQIASLAGIILGAIFAGKLSELIAPKLILWIDASPHIIAALSYIIAFLLIVIALLLIGKLLHLFAKAIKLSTANRIAGAFFCSVKWLIVFSILVNIVAEMDQNKSLIKEEVRENTYTYKYVTTIAQLAVPYLKFDWIDKPEEKDNVLPGVGVFVHAE